MNPFFKHEDTGGVRGMTLIEMLVVIAVGTAASLVLSANIIYLYKINQISYEQGFALESARRGIELLVRDIREATYSDDGSFPIVAMSPYSLIVYSDTDRDSSVERIRYFISGTNLKRGIVDATGTPLTYPTANEKVTLVSDYVRNSEQSIPSFTYYNAAGAEITDFTDVSDVTFVKVNLIVNISPTHLPDEFLLRSSAAVRNLRPNP